MKVTAFGRKGSEVDLAAYGESGWMDGWIDVRREQLYMLRMMLKKETMKSV